VRLRKRRTVREVGLAGAHWIARCVWCKRYRFGERWLDVGLFEVFARKSRVSDTVCSDCLTGLENERRSGVSS
jgi:hypothetical protein